MLKTIILINLLQMVSINLEVYLLMYNYTIEYHLNNKNIIKDISEKDQLIKPQEKLELKTVNA